MSYDVPPMSTHSRFGIALRHAHVRRSDHAARRTRSQHANRRSLDVLLRHHAAAGLHDHELVAIAGLASGERPASPDRTSLAVRHTRSRRSYWCGRIPDRAADLMRGRDLHAGQFFRDDLRHAFFVRGIDEGEEQRDRDRLDVLLSQVSCSTRAPRLHRAPCRRCRRTECVPARSGADDAA